MVYLLELLFYCLLKTFSESNRHSKTSFSRQALHTVCYTRWSQLSVQAPTLNGALSIGSGSSGLECVKVAKAPDSTQQQWSPTPPRRWGARLLCEQPCAELDARLRAQLCTLAVKAGSLAGSTMWKEERVSSLQHSDPGPIT